ncbi:MAG: antibiotic biosynthesis monooxygenase [Rhodospirillales bacterium]|nr:antibiotic biosynthesis monooxygenase [Rhodospirillales bacterium]
MIAVIFEVEPLEGKADQYFEVAASLRDELERTDGFVSVERFQSVTNEGKFLSLSFWMDHEAVERWYTHSDHSLAQTEGRDKIFRNYRIRVAEVFRDYDMVSGRPDV